MGRRVDKFTHSLTDLLHSHALTVDMGRRVDKFGGVPGVPTNNDRGGKKGLDVCLTADAC